MLEIIKAKHLNDYILILWFNDSSARVVDFKKLIVGEIYEPLKDIKFFRKFKIDCGTVSWKNGADFAPEFLQKHGKVFRDTIAAQYTILAAPELCTFDGIKIYINYNDHLPPHFHAQVGSANALININNLQIEEGGIPAAKVKKVLDWANENKESLVKNWKLARQKKPLERIPPPKPKKKRTK